MTRLHRVLTLALLAGSVGLGTACEDREPNRRQGPPGGLRTTPVRVVGGLQPGELAPGVQVTNPYRGDAAATGRGERLYRQMNCAGCHGMLGGGGIGPPLRDEAWIYGGEAQNIFMSVLQGRPQGMPSYGGKLPDEEIWRIIAYVQSLGGAPDAGDAPEGVGAPGRSGNAALGEQSGGDAPGGGGGHEHE